MTAVDLAQAVRKKELSPVEIIDAAERAQRAGENLGSLAGVPIGLKDLICTAGTRTVFGSVAYAIIPGEDDIVVGRVKGAGAVILGKTNVAEFGDSGVGHNPVFEATRNPWNADLTSGGSSAGSGAAVASGMCPFTLGSDGGGSVRIPSAQCGIYGMKAWMGRVPLYPGCRDERYPAGDLSSISPRSAGPSRMQP